MLSSEVLLVHQIPVVVSALGDLSEGGFTVCELNFFRRGR